MGPGLPRASQKNAMRPGFIPPHGGYKQLLSYQRSETVYDATVYFCDHFIDRRSRTHDQMVQAARSGKQNIIEASMASATSKETEIKLTNVARASLEELLADYRDFLESLLSLGSLQSVITCKATIARTPPATRVAPAMSSVARCARAAASVFKAACRSSSSLCQLRSTIAQPMMNAANGSAMRKTSRPRNGRALNHSTRRRAVWAGS
ncbi:MAG: hypothetical protein QOF89_2323 [Acidobacteriota bacterium]|nr:hypothetical protein [Acidobacteriota bacterium]